MHRILLLAVIACSCNQRDDRAPAAPARAALASSTQTDLAREIVDAERLGTWREVQQRWRGQTVRWTVTRQRLLCRTADDCNVAAFPIQRPARQGWMPQLIFAPGQFDALNELCGGQEQCDITVEGTVSQLEVSPELPTSVQLSNVRIVPPPSLPRAQTAHR